MEKLIVDEEGKVAIPAHMLSRRGLCPGDRLLLVEAAEGLLLYQRGVDAATARWWDSLSEDERRQPRAQARTYENLSEEEYDRLWGDRTESAEKSLGRGKRKSPTK